MYFDRFWLKPFEGTQFKNGLKPVPIDNLMVYYSIDFHIMKLKYDLMNY